MPEEKQQFLELAITVIIILLFLGILFLVMILLYHNRRKLAEKEKAILQQQFNAELLQTEFEVQEQTRKNLAADLHDNIGQLLSLTNVTLASIQITDREKTIQKIADTQELVTRSIRELRQLSKLIQGEQLIQQGLRKTIEQEIIWLERNGHFNVQFSYELPDFTENTADKDLFIYRLLQECLNNIIKHAGASRISIRLVQELSTLHLIITDDGVGFDTAEKPAGNGGLGLTNMQKRVSLLQGSMNITSVENSGTSVIFSIPYP